MSDTEIAKRHTVESLFALRCKLLDSIKAMYDAEKAASGMFEELGAYGPYRLDCRDDGRNDQIVDRMVWRYLVKLYQLDKYMLCTSYEKMQKEMDEYKFPEFTPDNAHAWLAGMKGLIHDNVATLIKQVFKEVTEGVYYVGGYNGDTKKRNNNGIDSNFILHTYDYSRVFGYEYKPTITDDLEKVCYLLDGKSLPDFTLINKMKGEKTSEYDIGYMRVKVCKNKNTHYWLRDDIREKLNRFGPDGAIIGENIKIKIVEKWRAA